MLISGRAIWTMNHAASARPVFSKFQAPVWKKITLCRKLHPVQTTFAFVASQLYQMQPAQGYLPALFMLEFSSQFCLFQQFLIWQRGCLFPRSLPVHQAHKLVEANGNHTQFVVGEGYGKIKLNKTTRDCSCQNPQILEGWSWLSDW